MWAPTVAAALLLLVPVLAAAQEADISPESIDFGGVCAGASVTDSFTVTSAIDDDLRIFLIVFLDGDNPSGAFSFDVLDPYGDPMPQDSYVTTEVTYDPVAVGAHAATLTVVTNDGTNPIQSVALAGQGIACSPTAAIVEMLLDEIDSGAIPLYGVGNGSSADGRYGAFVNMLEQALALLDSGLVDEACDQLGSALLRVDGESPPPDFVDGAGAADAYDDITAALSSLGCL